MTNLPEKKDWLDLSVSIRTCHVSKLKENRKWRIQDTAKLLNRSLGSVSQYLKIASWLKTHENQIRRCSSLRDALVLIDRLERERELS